MSNVKEILKLAMDSMKNSTLEELLKNDRGYQERVEEEKRAYCQLQGLELTEEEKDAIEYVLAKKDDVTYEYKINAYMAGMLDAYEILRLFDLTKE